MTKPTGKPIGRPSSYTAEIGERVLELYADGVTLEEIALEPWCPVSAAGIRVWGDDVPGFREKYLLARGRHADALAASTLTILDREKDPQRARVAIQARQWLAGKYRPQTYGERLEVVADHRVSLVDAIAAGRGRLLPGRDQSEFPDGQMPVLIDVSPNKPTDQRSADASAAQLDALPDWFD